ncbi:MAG: ribosome small subunit-dependent GTPase A [Clostridia bacterium]
MRTTKAKRFGGGSNIKQQIGQVIKGVAGVYWVKQQDCVVQCAGRGKTKQLGAIFIGDYVEIITFNNGKGAIEKVLPRKNQLVRPYVSNIDVVLIVVAPVPKPDLLLVDKLLINCIENNITPIVCINKMDIATEEFVGEIKFNYDKLCQIICVSASTSGGIKELVETLKNKYVCLAGQSAVGKSSILNTILGFTMQDVGELSAKILRGKNTTRTVEIFDIGNNILMADTCGFSILEVPSIEPTKLSGYYFEFDKYAQMCKYLTCNHINEPKCAVKQAVENGEISRQRYERYVQLYNQIDDKWKKRYD